MKTWMSVVPCRGGRGLEPRRVQPRRRAKKDERKTNDGGNKEKNNYNDNNIRCGSRIDGTDGSYFPSLSLSPSPSHTLLSLSLSVSQLEPTRAAPVTSPLTGERRSGALLICIHRPRPPPTRVTPSCPPRVVLRSKPVRKLVNEADALRDSSDLEKQNK